MSPDVFLHQYGLRYDSFAGFPSTDPAVILKALQTLNATRRVNEDTGQLEDIVHETEGFVPGPLGPASTSPSVIKALERANSAYLAALKTGNLALVHAAADALNHVRAIHGGQDAVNIPSDFEILAEGSGYVGLTARLIQSQRAGFENGEATLPFGSVIPWFDTPEAFRALAEYGAAPDAAQTMADDAAPARGLLSNLGALNLKPLIDAIAELLAQALSQKPK